MFKTLILATHNQGKIAEMKERLAGFGIEVLSAHDVDLPEPEETEDTFAGNALLKARAAAQATGKTALADDSGLCVNALDGAPGVYSARYAINPETGERDFSYAMKKLNDALADKDRSAYFACVLALVKPDGQEEIFEGRCEGILAWPPRGEGGFGYDPIFQPDGFEKTFGEMNGDEKHPLSHRGRALEKFIKSLSLGRG